MKRREFIALLGGAVTFPTIVNAQQPGGIRRIGMMMGFDEHDAEARSITAAFQQELERLGWSEGSNLRYAFCWTGGNSKRNTVCAGELADGKPDVILSSSTTPTAAVAKVTQKVPIVFAGAIDPVGSGLVASLAQPGGNVTGFTNFEYDIGGKWLQVLKEIAPSMARALFAMNPTSINHAGMLRSIEAAAHVLAVTITPAGVTSASEIERAIEAFASEGVGGLIVSSSPITAANRMLFVALAAKYRLPAVYPYRFFADDGGLMSYGADLADIFRRGAGYVDRILKGESPSTLPVQQPTKFELVINLRTARKLDLAVPPTLLARADEVIE